VKLIIKQYLASLKERDELDALLPDLLSQMGLNVFSRPGRGTRQEGVDVAAVGPIGDGPEKVYLFSVKAGDLSRKSWNGDSVQALRPSLDEILDAYIPTRLPQEHRGKEIVICLCFGGDIQEQVRTDVEGYIQKNSRSGLSFEQWNGDKLADLIQSSFLREDLLPLESRPLLRKSLALLDEPESSFKHFSNLIVALSNVQSLDDSQHIRALRQFNICLWILFAWCRDAGNLEAAYLSSERALLYAWELTKGYITKDTKAAKSIQLTFSAILNTYQLICHHFLAEKIIPHAGKQHGLSSAVRSMSKLDVNLKLFDVLGRLAMGGLWTYWNSQIIPSKSNEEERLAEQELLIFSQAIKSLISNNPTLFLPFKDEHAIDISLALLFLSFKDEHEEDMRKWLNEILDRVIFAYQTHGPYPCNLGSYRDLLEHPKRGDDDYRQEVTQGSILYPTISLWAALLHDDALFEKVKLAKEKHLAHCNFQFWYPDETSETHMYVNSDLHGAALSNAPVDLTPTKFLEAVWAECDHSNYFGKLSAQEYGFWPLTLVVCRHHRMPVPLQFTLGYRTNLVNKDSLTEGKPLGSPIWGLKGTLLHPLRDEDSP
jgi:hypothetical protein